VGRFRSVSVILSVCTGFLVLMLVTLCAVAARQHFDTRQAASRRLSIATIAQQMVVADEVLRDEVASRSELTKVAKPPSIATVFDYTITRKNYAQLRAAGWQPAR